MSKSKNRNSRQLIISPDRIFYWAYGSNLSVKQMRKRCPRAIKYGPMEVQDCALVFRYHADVTLREGATTPGGLWQITAECERELDAYEGVASRIYMKRYFRIKLQGKPHTCLFYQMRASEGVMPPSETYLDTIAQGYQDFGLDLNVLQAALEESWEQKEPTESLLDRHDRRGNPRLARDILGIGPQVAAGSPPVGEGG